MPASARALPKPEAQVALPTPGLERRCPAALARRRVNSPKRTGPSENSEGSTTASMPSAKTAGAPEVPISGVPSKVRAALRPGPTFSLLPLPRSRRPSSLLPA